MSGEDANKPEVTVAKQPRKSHKKLVKAVVIVLVILIVAIGGFALWTFIDSTRAINQYVEDVDTQYKNIASNQNIDQVNVQLRDVWLADLINPRYKEAVGLDADYQSLIDRLRNYTLIMEVHNQLIDEFNKGVEGDEVLNGDMLKLATEMDEMMHARYPDKTEQIAAMDQLCQTITSSTNFADISGEVNKVLVSNNAWLSDERNAIETARTEFQQSINSL